MFGRLKVHCSLLLLKSDCHTKLRPTAFSLLQQSALYCNIHVSMLLAAHCWLKTISARLVHSSFGASKDLRLAVLATSRSHLVQRLVELQHRSRVQNHAQTHIHCFLHGIIKSVREHIVNLAQPHHRTSLILVPEHAIHVPDSVTPYILMMGTSVKSVLCTSRLGRPMT